MVNGFNAGKAGKVAYVERNDPFNGVGLHNGDEASVMNLNAADPILYQKRFGRGRLLRAWGGLAVPHAAERWGRSTRTSTSDPGTGWCG